MRFTRFLPAMLLAGSSSAVMSLEHERAGDLIRKVHGGHHHWPESGIINNGTPTGHTVQLGGESLYLSYPRNKKTDYAVLYLTDIFGVQLVNNKLLADSIAKAGYFVVAPDLFRGDPVPADALTGGSPGFNMTAWGLRHPQSDVESIIESAIATMQTHFKAKKIASTGYCFGGRYVAIFLDGKRGIDVGFAAHPSAYQYSEWEAVAGPISIAFGALDVLNPPANRSEIESIFQAGNKTYQTALYGDVPHGFAVRTNTSDRQMAFAQEGAYLQAVRWFDYWLKGDE